MRSRLFLATALSAIVLALSGCAASHNLQTDGENVLGGGYYASEVGKGIHHISIKTNYAPWVNAASARFSWRSRADILCGEPGYREVNIIEGSFQAPYALGLPYISTTRDGYAVCKSAGLSDEEAMTSIGVKVRK